MKNKASILLVDDEKIIRDLFSEILENAGYEVLQAKDGREAIDLAGRRHPDVALVDIKMPKADGIEVLNSIKQIDKDIEIIIVTAFASLNTAIEAIKGDAFDYLVKPLGSVEDLVFAVRRALSKRKLASSEKRRAMFDKLPVLKADRKTLFLDLEDIYYCDAVQHHARVHCSDRNYLTGFSLSELEKHLKEKLFFRVHRSYLVNLLNVVEIVSLSAQKDYIVLADAKKTRIPMSHSRVAHLKEIMGVPAPRSSLQD